MRQYGLFCALIALTVSSTLAGEQRSTAAPNAAKNRAVPNHDPNCPGCRAFLAGYAADHGPSCSCATPGGPGEPGATGEDPGLGQELFASDFGAGYGYESAAPGMIGDFFGGLLQMQMGSIGMQQAANVANAGGDRRFKIAENYSPFPSDRIFFNYNHFHNALLTADAREANFNRGVFGVETTFLDQMMSLELRIPFGSGLNSDQFVDPTANNVSNEFGNIAFALKGLLLQRETVAISAGLGVVLPTGPDTTLYAAGATSPFFILHNDSYYLQPFAGMLWRPDDQFFALFSVQGDFDARGNKVEFPQSTTYPGGRVQDQSLLYLDASFGYWLFRDPFSDAIVTGLAPILEFHYNTTLEDPDVADAADGTPVGSRPSFGPGSTGFDSVTNFRNRVDVLNLTAAVRLEILGRSYLTLFGVAPLRTDDDKMFDMEYGVQFSRVY